MHLIFERPKGRFKSNCNILALAWMPYYNAQGPHGRMKEFGWLAIGNIGKLIGVTLTSLVPPPREIDGRESNRDPGQCNKKSSDDLIELNDDDDAGRSGQSAPEGGGQAKNCSNSSQLKPPADYEKIRPDRKCMRSNYNLRGHRDEIILVQWNEFYQKLATVDSKGNVLIWCRTNEKFTIQTPFYNRSKSVADFKWSNDGKTALICYTDSFILVGGSSGQRHWHSMLNLEDYHITCASWTPTDEKLLLGVSNGNVVLIDLQHSELTEMIVGQANIRTMCWSPTKLHHASHAPDPGGPESSAGPRGRQGCDLGPSRPFAHEELMSNLNVPLPDGSIQTDGQSPSGGQCSTIVNRRRLSLNCALFCRHCPSTAQGTHNRDCTRRPDPQNIQHHHHHHNHHHHNHQHNHNQQQQAAADFALERAPADEPSRRLGPGTGTPHRDILAIDFANNTIKLFDGGLGDAKPKEIQVNLESYLMSWSSSGEVLAVGGFNIYTSAPSVGYLRCKYLNYIKFYNQRGGLIYEHKMGFTRYPVTALTWAHSDQRLFIATGPRLHCARVHFGIPSLNLLALSCLHRNTKTMDKADVLKALLHKQLVTAVLNWQSFNCPLDLVDWPSRESSFREQRKQRHERSSDSNCDTDRSGGLVMAAATDIDGSGTECATSRDRASLANNINVDSYQLPAKLKAKIDQMFLQTLRQPFDEQLSLNDIVWHVPKSQQRHYCTLICYTHELPDIGCIGHQYKAQELAEQLRAPESALSSTSSLLSPLDNQASDQYKIFVLYVEHQGSLIPILKARRVGFLKPEFVIFDPERTNGRYSQQQHHKVSDVSGIQLTGPSSSFSEHNRQHPHHHHHHHHNHLKQQQQPHQKQHQQQQQLKHDQRQNHSERHKLLQAGPALSSQAIKHMQQPTRVLAHENNPLGNCSDLHNQESGASSRMNCPAAASGDRQTPAKSAHAAALRAHPMLQDPYLIYLLNLRQKRSRQSAHHGHHNRDHHSNHHRQSGRQSSTSQEARMAIERYKMLSRASGNSAVSHALAASSSTTTLKTLPETSELLRIRSNIWGTKFKLINVGNRMIGVRALLGSVMYKASILHLQPRQIFLNLKDMSNYCVLCSMHHHTKLPSRRRPGRGACTRSLARGPARLERGPEEGGVSLIDLPLAPIDHLATPTRSSSQRHSRAQGRQQRAASARPGLNHSDRSQSATRQLDGDKVILPVGDSIRVAPKLEAHQRYKFAGQTDQPASARARAGALAPVSALRGRVAKPPLRQIDKLRQDLAAQRSPAPSVGSRDESPVASTSAAASSSLLSAQMADNNDILTLSLDQGDQVRVEMSSLGTLSGVNQQHGQQLQQNASAARPGLDHFLQANKTLKSIQSITKMIVDLSSRAQAAETSPQKCDTAHLNEGLPSSPSPVKLFRASQDRQQASPARRYIPPDTPVHRPHRRHPASGSQATQSASSTPLRMVAPHRHLHQHGGRGAPSDRIAFDSDCPLPSPPPSVPFRRKLSSSAKRLFDGSLRSLAGLGTAGPMGAGYATSDDLDSEDCEALVGARGQHHMRRPSRAQARRPRAANAAAELLIQRHQSQPCSPVRSQRQQREASSNAASGLSGFFKRASSSGDGGGHKQSSLDLAQLRAQVVQKLRRSAGWMSASESKLEIDTDAARPHKAPRAGSATRRSRWVHRGAGGDEAEPFGYKESSALGSSSSSVSSSGSSASARSSSGDESLDFSSDDGDGDGDDELSLFDRAMHRTGWFRGRSRCKGHSASARDLNELGRMSLDGGHDDGARDKEALADAARLNGARGRHKRKQNETAGRELAHRRRHRRRAKRSICANSDCCCSHEIKLNNRPPVWNEYSQVYQLDFGGRVTQESAKNLQIDFNGNLALQFGRVDKCTYTLDYKYPFNAVQAMSIALASLTQRLK